MTHPIFSKTECERYDRHFKLSVLGVEGQFKLRSARVLCVGVGGLGTPACLYLAAAGVGTLGLVDHDKVELTNLQRQILYNTRDMGQNKAKIAQSRLAGLNTDIEIIAYPERLTPENANVFIHNYDIVLDGSDNFATHYLLNDVCHHLKKPLVWAAVAQTQGRCSVFNIEGGVCYRCLFPNPPPVSAMGNCSDMGVLGVLPGLLGVIQATEIVKLVAQIGEPLINRLLCVDMLTMGFQEYCLEKNSDCPLCSGVGYVPEDYFKDYLIGECHAMNSVTVQDLQKLLTECPDDICVLDVRRPDEYAICHIGGQLISFEELPNRLSEIDKTKHVVVHCRSGGRSAKATKLLIEAGFPRVSNLSGGIMAWIDTIDPSMTKY